MDNTPIIVKINDKDVPCDFKGMLEVHLDPMNYGVFDVIGKRTDNSESEVLFKNAVVSVINPRGTDMNLSQGAGIKVHGDESYITDCATYDKICSLKNLTELRSSVS